MQKQNLRSILCERSNISHICFSLYSPERDVRGMHDALRIFPQQTANTIREESYV